MPPSQQSPLSSVLAPGSFIVFALAFKLGIPSVQVSDLQAHYAKITRSQGNPLSYIQNLSEHFEESAFGGQQSSYELNETGLIRLQDSFNAYKKLVELPMPLSNLNLGLDLDLDLGLINDFEYDLNDELNLWDDNIPTANPFDTPADHISPQNTMHATTFFVCKTAANRPITAKTLSEAYAKSNIGGHWTQESCSNIIEGTAKKYLERNPLGKGYILSAEGHLELQKNQKAYEFMLSQFDFE